MKAIGILFVLMTIAACAWLVADGDRARLERWTAQWTLGTLNHVDDILQRGAELRMRIDRLEAEKAGFQGEKDDLHHYIATLEDNLAYQMQVGRRQEREAAERLASFIVAQKSAPKIIRLLCPRAPVPRCFDHIANELNAVEALRR